MNGFARKFFVTLGWLAWCALILVAGTALGWVNSSEVVRSFLSQTLTNADPKQVFKEKDGLYLLLLGCDETRDPRTKQILKKNARSDMMMVVRLDFDTNMMSGLSIPRDLEVDLRGYPPHKINAFHDIGGPDLSKTAVESILPVQIDRVLVLDYDAFKDLVDLLGGVEVYIDKPLKYTDTWGDLYIDLEPGRQKLNGEEAMGYVRIRKVDSDFGRQGRQREFLVSLKNAMAKNPAMLPRVANKSIELLGNSLTPIEMAALIRFAQKVGTDNIKLQMLPVTERRRSTSLDMDREKAKEVLTQLGFISVEGQP